MSQHYLDLFLYVRISHRFTERTPRVKETIDSWPEVPLYLEFLIDEENKLKNDTDNLHAALVQRDRISHMHVIMMGLEANWLADLIREEFPRLKHLELWQESPRNYEVAFVIFDRLLGGSAPSLQHLTICGFEYQGLPSLLLSAPNLISLKMEDIRLACYMSPEAMAGALAGLTKLRELTIAFSFLQLTHHDAEGFQSSPTHAVFPALTKLRIEADNAYLENLMDLIDAPRLDDLHVKYLKPKEAKELRAGNISQFIGRTETFKHAQLRRAEVTLDRYQTSVVFDIPRDECQQTCLSHQISDQEDWTLPFVDTVSHVTNWLGQLVMMLSDVQSLSIRREWTIVGDFFQKDINWLLFLRLFPAVEVLHVREEMVKHIASVLEGIPEEMVTQVLPALELLWLDDVQGQEIFLAEKGNGKPESVDQFLSLRKKSGRPVVVVRWHHEFMERLSPRQLKLRKSRKIHAGDYEFMNETTRREIRRSRTR